MDEGALKRAGITAPQPPPKRAVSMDVFPMYDTTAQRDLAVHLCGWVSLGEDGALAANLRRMEAQGDHARAAAVALFHHDIQRAIATLTNGSKAGGPAAQGFLAAAMSLAGYTPRGDNQLWMETCAHLR